MKNISIENMKYQDQGPGYIKESSDESKDHIQEYKEELLAFTDVLTPELESVVLVQKQSDQQPEHMLRITRKHLDYRIINKQHQQKMVYRFDLGELTITPQKEDTIETFCDHITGLFNALEKNKVDVFEEPKAA